MIVIVRDKFGDVSMVRDYSPAEADAYVEAFNRLHRFLRTGMTATAGQFHPFTETRRRFYLKPLTASCACAN